MSPLEVNKFLSQLRTTFTSIENLPFPTITALDGLAMGGGMEMSLCTDLRVAGENLRPFKEIVISNSTIRRFKEENRIFFFPLISHTISLHLFILTGPSASRLGLTETSLGIIPGAGGTTRMTRLIGKALTKDLIFSSRLLNHHEALKKGVVQYCAEVGDEDCLDEIGLETGTEGREALGKSYQVVQKWLGNGEYKGSYLFEEDFSFLKESSLVDTTFSTPL